MAAMAYVGRNPRAVVRAAQLRGGLLALQFFSVPDEMPRAARSRA